MWNETNMAANSVDAPLSDIFDRAFLLHSQIEDDEEPSSSEKIQIKISEAVNKFVRATEVVNSLGLFSTNEELDEVPTSELRYLLLPAFLGDLFLRQMAEDRLTLLNISKVYFLDFCKRCRNYGVTEMDVSKYTENAKSRNSEQKGIHEMVKTRQEKIARYKEKREQEGKLKELRKILDVSTAQHDEEIQRKYYILLLKLWLNKAIEHLASIHSEIEMLEHMDKLKKQGGDVQQATKPPVTRGMKPFLITKENIKKGVFGAGYPSVPTMSQEEFLEKEIREGKVVLEYKDQQTHSTDEEKEKKKEDEQDDPANLKKARDWDDWKDDHRRGWGNRDNMG